MDKNKLTKIIVPILIVIAIIGIWFVKSHRNIPVVDNPSSTSSEIVTNEDFKLEATNIDLKALKDYKLPIVIDFGSDSCIPCKEMAPVLKKFNEEMQGKAIIKFIDVWKNSEAAANFPVQVIPTQIFYTADGKPYVPSDNLEIEFTMYSFEKTNEHAFTVHQGGLTEEQMGAILKDMGVE